MKPRAWSALIVPALLSVSRSSEALPAPMSEQELTAQAEVVVDAHVTDISCEKADAGPPVSTSYISNVVADAAIKGSLSGVFTYRGEVIDGANCSAQTEPLAKGWAGRLYLKKLPDGPYTLTYYNGAKEDLTKSMAGPLPACGGAGGAAGGGGSAGTSTAGTAGMAQAGSSSGGSAGAAAAPSADDGGGCTVGAVPSNAGLGALGVLAVVGVARRRRRA